MSVTSFLTHLDQWSTVHPCAGCGHCCATYRVAFHWMETVGPGERSQVPPGQPAVPVEMTETIRLHEVAMRGTSSSTPRCIALVGELGVDARCSIHASRPGCCRDVQIGSDQCTRARLRNGLAPVGTMASGPDAEDLRMQGVDALP